MSALESIFSKPALAPLATVAILALLASAPAANAYAPTRACNGAFCAESYRIVEGGSYVIRFSFRGSSVNHYNVRFVERGGREVQKEVSTTSGSNWSQGWRVRSTPGNTVTLSVQACNRATFGSSKCTQWKIIKLTLS